MLYWVFDLDSTLYQLNDEIQFDYKYLNKDNQLSYLLKKLPLKKVMFTNGTLGHAHLCINKIELMNCFHNIVARDTIQDLKPANSSFEKFMKVNNINSEDKCIFFDDMPDNLIVAKTFGWITVLISPNKTIHENIDFHFSNIHLALNYFLTKIITHTNIKI